MNLNIKTLREKRVRLIDDMETIVSKAESEKRELNADELKAFNDIKAQSERVRETLEAAEHVEHMKAIEARPVQGGVVQPQQQRIARPRHGQLRSFFGENAEERAYRSGMWLRATIWNDEKAAQWCRDNGIAIQRAQSEGVNTAGGFLVPDEMSSAIIDLRETYGVFRRECRVWPMARDTLMIPRRTSGVTAYFIGEGSAITASQMAWDMVQLTAKKIAAYVLYSTELADDATINIADTLAGEIAYAFASKEDDCGFNGTGAGGTTYGGITGARVAIIDGTHTAGAKDAATGVDTFAEITATDLATAMTPLPQYAIMRGAKWYCSQQCWSGVFQRLVAAGGGNTIDTLTGQVRPSYLGYPIVISQAMPTSTGDLSDVVMLFFGNLSLAASLGDRRGVSIAMSEHIKFAEDQIAIRGTERVDINVHDLGDNTNAGPLIGLVGD